MRILVTGGAGFLGAHLCERLIEEGHEVICVDNLSTGQRVNVFHLLQHPNFSFLLHDVCEPLRLEGLDQIYNLASPASPPDYQKDPIQTTKTSVLGALNVLGLAKRVGATALQASTSEVYGDPLIHPQPESYWGNVNPIGIRSCYDEGKRCAESLFFDYERFHGVDVRVARIFNTYGHRMRANDGRVVSNFIMQALKNHPLTVYGDGTQTRSFCFVTDTVDGLMRLMNSKAQGPVNIGNPAEFTVKYLAHLVRELCGSKSPIEYKALPQDDPKQRRPDISKAKEVLGWVPKVSLDDGLRMTIGYFSQQAHVLPPTPQIVFKNYADVHEGSLSIN